MEDLALMLAGRRVPDVTDRLRRYCGLKWSGGPSEVWAFAYYDALLTDPDRVEPTDVLAAAAMHPGLSREDLTFFSRRRPELEQWLSELPGDEPLQRASEATLTHLDGLLAWTDAVSLGLLTKVLHRKRPSLIPLVDRAVLDWYRPVTGERSADAAWPKLIRTFWDSGDREPGYNVMMAAIASSTVEKELASGLELSVLRVADIAIWMGAQR
jgi:hypothetical protein